MKKSTENIEKSVQTMDMKQAKFVWADATKFIGSWSQQVLQTESQMSCQLPPPHPP